MQTGLPSRPLADLPQSDSALRHREELAALAALGPAPPARRSHRIDAWKSPEEPALVELLALAEEPDPLVLAEAAALGLVVRGVAFAAGQTAA